MEVIERWATIALGAPLLPGPALGRLGRMYFPVFQQFKKQLGQLDTWLESAIAHAKTKSFEPTVYMTARLSPDQFPFARQVQVACDTAKLAASRLRCTSP